MHRVNKSLFNTLATTFTTQSQPPRPGVFAFGLLVAGFLSLLTLAPQAAPAAPGQGRGRTLLRAPADGVSDLLPLGDLPRTTRRARRVLADPTALQGEAATGDDVVTLDLFDDVALRARRTGLEGTRRGGYVWKGELLDLPGEAAIAVQDGVLTGTVFALDTVYEIRYRGHGEHEVREIEPKEFPPDDDPQMDLVIDAPDTGGAGVGGAAAVPDTGAQIDVMVVWTPAARTSVGGTAAMQSLIDLAMANANTAYANSGVSQRIRLVHAEEVPYTEAGASTDLSRLASSGDGFLDQVQTLRDQYGADLVSLLGNGYGCGLGYMMGTPSAGFAPYGYNVVDQTCAAGNLSLAHELGHNMGLNHDPANATGTPAYTYAYGYQQPSGLFRTVMAYPCPSGSCPRLMYFSNPNVTYSGMATGTSTQNNALALNNTANTVANFRQSVSGGCTYALTPTSASPAAGGGAASFTVTSATGCTWTATSNQAWATVTSGASGSGSGPVGYSVAANPGSTTRSATITAGGQAFTVTQAAAACSYSVSPTSASSAAAGGSASFTVTTATGCTWTATSNQSWVTVTSGASGSGTGTVGYSVALNTGGTSRSATITAGGHAFTVTQATAALLTVTALTADTTFPVPSGTSITWTAVAIGGVAPLQYQFWLYSQATAVWTIVRDYSTFSTYTWNTGKREGGTYALQVRVRSAGSVAPFDASLTTAAFVLTGPKPR